MSDVQLVRQRLAALPGVRAVESVVYLADGRFGFWIDQGMEATDRFLIGSCSVLAADQRVLARSNHFESAEEDWMTHFGVVVNPGGES